MFKKSQIKFGETIAILIIVYVVLMSGLMWYNKSSTAEITKMGEETQNEKAFEKYSYIENLNLLHVSQRGIIDNEYDKNSLIAFANYTKNMTNFQYIRNNLEESTVTIKLYNYTNLDTFESYLNITLYNNTPKDITSTFYDQPIYRTLVSVVDINEKRTDIGLLEIKVYIKK